MQVKREFVYERFKRDIYGVEDVKKLQEIACKFLHLYLAQQETVEALINQKWLPKADDKTSQ
jgi:hypothetical protein